MSEAALDYILLTAIGDIEEYSQKIKLSKMQKQRCDEAIEALKVFRCTLLKATDVYAK